MTELDRKVTDGDQPSRGARGRRRGLIVGVGCGLAVLVGGALAGVARSNDRSTPDGTAGTPTSSSIVYVDPLLQLPNDTAADVVANADRVAVVTAIDESE